MSPQIDAEHDGNGDTKSRDVFIIGGGVSGLSADVFLEGQVAKARTPR